MLGSAVLQLPVCRAGRAGLWILVLPLVTVFALLNKVGLVLTRIVRCVLFPEMVSSNCKSVHL